MAQIALLISGSILTDILKRREEAKFEEI